MRKLVRALYKLSRIVNDAETVSSGKPKRIARRAKNKVVGRGLGKLGVWRKLWK